MDHYVKLGWTVETVIELFEAGKIDEKKVVEILQKSLQLIQKEEVSEGKEEHPYL